MKKEESCGTSCSCGAESSGLLANRIDRRKFFSLGAYAAAAAALAACGGAGADNTVTSPGGSTSGTVKISDYAALSAVGGVAVTSLNGTPIAIVRTSASAFLTLSRVCPHQGTTVNATATGFKCPNHGATFDTAGTWIGGQRTSNMRAYTTTYDAGSGTLTIG